MHSSMWRREEPDQSGQHAPRGPGASRRPYVRPELEVVDGDGLIQHKLIVASGCESRPGSYQEAR